MLHTECQIDTCGVVQLVSVGSVHSGQYLRFSSVRFGSRAGKSGDYCWRQPRASVKLKRLQKLNSFMRSSILRNWLTSAQNDFDVVALICPAGFAMHSLSFSQNYDVSAFFFFIQMDFFLLRKNNRWCSSFFWHGHFFTTNFFYSYALKIDSERVEMRYHNDRTSDDIVNNN